MWSALKQRLKDWSEQTYLLSICEGDYEVAFVAPEESVILRNQVNMVMVKNYGDPLVYMDLYGAMAIASLVFKVFLLWMGEL